MRISPYVSILFLILLMSGLSGTLLYLYLDPEKNLLVAYVTMGMAAGLAGASFFSLILYFFKRIYYRGLVNPSVLHASVRQGFLLAAGCIGIIIFNKVGILNLKTGGLLFFILFLFELMMQSLVQD